MRRRIIVSLGILLGLYLLGDAIAMLSLGRSIGQLSRLAESRRIQSLRVDLSSGAIHLEADLHAAMSPYEHSPERRTDSMRRFEATLDQCAGCHHEPAVQADLDGIRELYLTYKGFATRLFNEAHEADAPALERNASETVDRVVAETTGLADRAAKHLAFGSTNATANVQKAWNVLFWGLLVTLAFGGIVAFHLKRRLTKPVETLLAGIERVRLGDLDHRFSLKADEEFRRLAEAFNRACHDLKQAQESLLRAERLAAVGKLAAGVAHEVSNPLASISSIAQMMRRECAAGKEGERIDLIMAQIARISRIVRELLTFSHPGSNAERGHVDLGELLDRAVALIQYDGRARALRITCEHPPGLPRIHGDADKLQLVVTNILLNALDAVTSGENRPGTLDVTARRQDDVVVVRFADNGPGMSDEQIARAFEPFFTTKAPGAGTGLGLWICYQVIRSHNGSIRIDSTQGKGTTITVELPCEPGESEDKSPSSPAHDSESPKDG